MMIGAKPGIELHQPKETCVVASYFCIALVLHEIPNIGYENSHIQLYTAID